VADNEVGSNATGGAAHIRGGQVGGGKAQHPGVAGSVNQRLPLASKASPAGYTVLEVLVAV